MKLAVEPSTKNYVAIKILKKGNPRLDDKFLELVMTEVQTMDGLSHPNILNMLEYSKDGVVKKSNGQSEAVIYIVLELAQGGELFDFVAQTGRYSEHVARFYFNQLLDGLEYVHKRGVTHRDLKPENLLYDGYFNLKIADFGFAAPMQGRDGSGSQKTKLGTESYMAPEIHMRKPYSGESVDLFAAGIILFIMYTQHPPFTCAKPEDPFYKLICANRHDLFWKAHSKNKPEGFFSEAFINLINGLLQFDPSMRPSMAQVREDAWVTGDMPTLEQVQKEFVQRKQALDAELEAERRAKEAERAARKDVIRQHKGTKGYNRAVSSGEEEEKGNEDPRELQPWVDGAKKNTEFFSNERAEDLLASIDLYLSEKQYKFQVSDNKYKVKFQVLYEDKPSVEGVVRVLKVNENQNCVEVSKVAGERPQFFSEYKEFEKALAGISDAKAN